MWSDAFVRGIMGPVGSGKSALCTNELLRLIMHQPNSRWVVVRNTYRELEDTTINTWMDWARPLGEFKHRTMTHYIKQGEHTAEVLFRALDRPQDIGKLLSLELTGAWVNEAREIPKAIIDMLQTRLGRYPPIRDGGPVRSCLLLDTNPPDDFSWWYRCFSDGNTPDGWELFRQPGGLDPLAENLDNLVPDYYQRIAAGKDQAWIDVYVNGQYGYVVDGKPVYPEFNARAHVAEKNIQFDPELRQVVGLDFGLTPAAAFLQQTATGQWQVWHEIVTEDTGAATFAEILGKFIRTRPAEYEIWGDPAGDQRSAIRESETPFKILRAAGINAKPAPTQDPILRREAVARNLTRLDMGAQPGLIISPTCRYLRRGMNGGFKYRQVQVSGYERWHDKAEKNIYSHICEAAEYGLCGAGEARTVVGSGRNWEPIDYTDVDGGVVA